MDSFSEPGPTTVLSSGSSGISVGDWVGTGVGVGTSVGAGVRAVMPLAAMYSR